MARDDMTQSVAVLTGDLVRSTALSHEDLVGVRTVLETATHEVSGWGRGAVHGPDVFRGDSWQVVLADGSVNHCPCSDETCPVFIVSDDAAKELDRARSKALATFGALAPDFAVRLA